MRRLMMYDHLGNPLGELAESDVFAAVLREEINGEHSLEITTTRVLDKGTRLLYQDGRSKWREFVVAGVDAEHASGNRAIGTYYCVWSVQNDLMGVTVSVMPGVQSPTTAALALDSLLSSTSRWVRGTVTNTATGGASMYDRSAWEALSTLVEVWGGEVDATITTSTTGGVTGRAVDLHAQQGEQTAKRRFDFGADLLSVKRTLADDPLFCRISPRGAGEETDAGGYGRKITIASVNSGVDYLEYSPMVDAAKLPKSGGYEYPTLIVENSDCKTPTELKTWAQSVLAEYCTPKVSYEIDVVQAGVEGVDVSGVSLGDAVQVVDRKFSDDGIRIEGRVRSITTDLLNERDISLTIGDANESVSSKFANVDKSLATVSNSLTVMSTAEYVTNLLDRINAEINATGGYTYITEGYGIRTYDTAVSDPLVGSEASAVVEIKGGTIRIANTKTAQGEWEWKTVFTSGHIAAEVVTAAQITTGYIGSSGDTFIDLDNHTAQFGLSSSYHTVIDSNGITNYYSTDKLSQFTSSSAQIGKDNNARVEISADAIVLYVKYGNETISRLKVGGTYDELTFGNRQSGYTVGNYSTVIGIGSRATANYATAIGNGTRATGLFSLAVNNNTTASGQSSTALNKSTASGDMSLATGDGTTASGIASSSFGYQTKASGNYAAAFGYNTSAASDSQLVCGKFNSNYSTDLFEVGNGSSTSSRANAFRVTTSNTAYVGSTQVTSDRRVKTPLGDISEEEAAEFVRQLKPSKFVKFGRRELGFYAQDVEDTNLGEYLVDESNDHGYEDFKNLSYDGLIAPLVAYCKHLEKRIEALEGGR